MSEQTTRTVAGEQDFAGPRGRMRWLWHGSKRAVQSRSVRVRGFAGVADAIDGIRAALESRPAALEKSAQRGRLAQQH